MSEKMRDGFESWCLAKGYTLRPAETNCGIIIEGDYGHPTVQIAWQAWQASRAALVVELPPEREERFIDSYQEGWNDAIDSCRVRVESVGVTCK